MIEEFLRFLINLSYFSFINEVVRPINAQNGDLLPVSAFKGYEDYTWRRSATKATSACQRWIGLTNNLYSLYNIGMAALFEVRHFLALFSSIFLVK